MSRRVAHRAAVLAGLCAASPVAAAPVHAPVPGPSVVEAPFCASPGSRACATAAGRPVRFWWGRAFSTGDEDRYVGFVVALPGAGQDARAPLPLMATEFVRRGAAWQVAGHSGPIGQIDPSGLRVETRIYAPTQALPDGAQIFAVPTVAILPGKRIHSYQLLRRDATGWTDAGSVPAATDDTASCHNGVPMDRDEPDECDTVQGSLLFDGPLKQGWPELVVDVDLRTHRNGQPLTATGWELHRYAYSADAHGYVLLKR